DAVARLAGAVGRAGLVRGAVARVAAVDGRRSRARAARAARRAGAAGSAGAARSDGDAAHRAVRRILLALEAVGAAPDRAVAGVALAVVAARLVLLTIGRLRTAARVAVRRSALP